MVIAEYVFPNEQDKILFTVLLHSVTVEGVQHVGFCKKNPFLL